MNCPVCESDQTKVLDSREKYGGTTIARRRLCIDCDNRWNTYELPESQVGMLLNKNFKEKKAEKVKDKIAIGEFFLSNNGGPIILKHDGIGSKGIQFDSIKLLSGLCQVLEYAYLGEIDDGSDM